MKSDLDRLMEADQIDAILTLPSESDDPYRTYLANGASFHGFVLKQRGKPPVLVANGMELGEAAKSGLEVYNQEDFGHSELMATHGYGTDAWRVAWFRRIFEHFGVRGRITVYGVADVNAAYRTILNLSQGLSDLIEIVPAEIRNSLFDRAYETKDADELDKLREVGRKTSGVMRAAREWIAGHRADGDIVVKADGSPLTIGDVKQQVRRLLFEQNLTDPEGMIFAQGRDSGMPHSAGEDADPLRLGQSIVFDLFPRAANGYYHDMTRTWCIGTAPREVLALYEAVMEAYRIASAACKIGTPTNKIQQMVCEFFEDLNHPTVLTTPHTTEGYTHSLAHGLGLNVHEAPFFPTQTEKYFLRPGNVFTIEPGLYYPERGYGMRIEDTVYLNEQGELEILTDCPYDLVIELKGER